MGGTKIKGSLYARYARQSSLSSADRDRFEAFPSFFSLGSYWLPEAFISCAGRVERPIDSAEKLWTAAFSSTHPPIPGQLSYHSSLLYQHSAPSLARCTGVMPSMVIVLSNVKH